MRHLFTLTLGGLLGVCLLAGDASACHKKKCCAPAPVVCYQPVPVTCAPVSCAPRKKCGLFSGLCHKKTCAPAPCVTVVTCNYAPTYYAAPMASGQYYGSPQASGQSYGMPPVPTK